MNSNEWFASWFDTEYYHLLYKDRDFEEAKHFIQNLVKHLQISENARVLDLACGKGRHAQTLSEHGLDVLGVDLSEQSISEASKMEHPHLHFKVHDMRYPIDGERFDYIFNLFTSFGYFENDETNLDVLKNINGMLRFNGTFVFDFLNSNFCIKSLVPREEKEIEQVKFDIRRNFDGKYIRKEIDVNDSGKVFHFEEKVRGYCFEQLKDLLTKGGFSIQTIFGSFDLEPFQEEVSQRAIFICKRTSDL